jgi:amidase
MGAMITGRMGEDARVLRLAAELEEARPWFDRRPPIRA